MLNRQTYERFSIRQLFYLKILFDRRFILP